jgi:hypothetical protein
MNKLEMIVGKVYFRFLTKSSLSYRLSRSRRQAGIALLFAFLASVAKAQGEQEFVCSYNSYGVPFAEVTLKRLADGGFADSAKISIQGQTHHESFTVDRLEPGEVIHGWLSLENPENTLELIVYSESQKQGNSKMINSRAPVGKEMWGTCQEH